MYVESARRGVDGRHCLETEPIAFPHPTYRDFTPHSNNDRPAGTSLAEHTRSMKSVTASFSSTKDVIRAHTITS